MQANPPNPEKIPLADLVGVTVVLLTCSYRAAEFIRIGYYVSNDYTEPELREVNPSPPQWDKLQRNILATNPRLVVAGRIKFYLSNVFGRVTKFKINWDNTTDNSENVPPKVDPNQMSSENSQSMDGPLKSGNGLPPPGVGMETD